MPNWCCQNVVIKGDKKELQEFADTINSLPTREDAAENGFGKTWLGNLVAAMGGDWEKVPCRGTVDASYNCLACLCGPDRTEEKAEIDDDGFLRISITTAWDVESELYAFIKSKFPSFEFGYNATDEFESFHTRWEPDPAMRVPKYAFNGELYAEDEKAELTEAIREATETTEADVEDDATIDELKDFIDNWKESNGSDEYDYLWLATFKDKEL